MITMQYDEATGLIHVSGSVALSDISQAPAPAPEPPPAPAPAPAPAPPPPAPIPARGIWMRRTVFGEELLSTIALTKGANYTNPHTGALGYFHRVLYTLPLPTLQPGDVIDARTTFELTNNLGFNVMACRFLVLTDAPTDAFKVLALISRPAGRNITPDMHHDIVHDFGTYQVTEEMAGVSVSVIVYAASSAAVTGNTLKVERNYGALEVKVYPKEMVSA